MPTEEHKATFEKDTPLLWSSWSFLGQSAVLVWETCRQDMKRTPLLRPQVPYPSSSPDKTAKKIIANINSLKVFFLLRQNRKRWSCPQSHIHTLRTNASPSMPNLFIRGREVDFSRSTCRHKKIEHILLKAEKATYHCKFQDKMDRQIWTPGKNFLFRFLSSEPALFKPAVHSLQIPLKASTTRI